MDSAFKFHSTAILQRNLFKSYHDERGNSIIHGDLTCVLVSQTFRSSVLFSALMSVCSHQSEMMSAVADFA